MGGQRTFCGPVIKGYALHKCLSIFSHQVRQEGDSGLELVRFWKIADLMKKNRMLWHISKEYFLLEAQRGFVPIFIVRTS